MELNSDSGDDNATEMRRSRLYQLGQALRTDGSVHHLDRIAPEVDLAVVVLAEVELDAAKKMILFTIFVHDFIHFCRDVFQKMK